MSDDTSQEADPAEQEGGYGFPTLEQEVTPEVLRAGAEPDDSARVGAEPAEGPSGDGPTPGELVEDPSAVEPTD